MGIVANGKANYIRKLNDAYSQSFAERYLNQIKIPIIETNSIKNYLENQTIKGALIGINYIYDDYETNKLREKGYYSFYFFADEETKYHYGIVLELINNNLDENKNHIFQKKRVNNFLTYYGLDYDQFLFQRASIALIETNSDIFETNSITLKSILKYLSSKKGEMINQNLIDLSQDFCFLVCEYLNLSIENIYDIISDKKTPKGKNIITEKILNQLDKKNNNNIIFDLIKKISN